MNDTLPFPIYKEIQIDEYKIVLLDWGAIPDSSIYINRNVFGLKDGKIVWQIEEFDFYPGYRKVCPYTGMVYIENELRLANWCDLDLVVDYKTGRVISKKESR